MLSKRLFSGMHRVAISACETVLQCNARNGTKEIDQLKHLSLKIQEETTKNVAITEKREKNMLDKSYTPTRGIYLLKLLLDIDFTDKLGVQYDLPVVENNFADDCK